MSKKGLVPPSQKKESVAAVYNNATKLIALIGGAQSGKETSCNYLAGVIWQTSGLVKDCFVDDLGKLCVKDLNGYAFPKGRRLDVLNWNNDDEVNEILKTCSPHPMNLVQKVAFGDPLKQAIHVMFGIDPALLWGTDKDKNTETQYTANQFIDVLGTTKFPFKDKKGSDKLTVREIMQCFGSEIGRRISENLWVDRTVENIYTIVEQWRPQLIVVEDCRFQSEFDSIKKMNGATIGLKRKPKSSAGNNHASEQAHKLFGQCDFVIDNSNMSIREQCLELWNIWQTINMRSTNNGQTV